MLNKIGAFTFLETLLLTLLIGWASPEAGTLFKAYAIPIKIFSVEVPLLYVVPAILVALIARIFRLHDKLSDALRLRHTFDLYRVLVPLAGAVGVAVDEPLRTALSKQRKTTMQRTFYRYASFEDPKISKALVLSSIDTWTWYWILSELLVVLAIAAALLLYLEAFKAATLVSLCAWLLTIIFCTAYNVCGNKVDYQIEEIVSDPVRFEALHDEFMRIKSNR
jgi:hypothetical protein